jgi:hypothetical protein
MAWFFPWLCEMQKAPVGLLRLGRFSIPVVARPFLRKGGVVGEVIDGKDKYFPLSAVIVCVRCSVGRGKIPPRRAGGVAAA